MGGGSLGDFPNEVPGQYIRQSISKIFHVGLIHVTGLGGTHVGYGIVMTVDGAFIQKLGNDFFSGRTVIGKLRAAQTVFFIGKQVIQRNYGILPGEVGGNVIRVGDADIGCRIGGNIGNDIVVNFAVIRV